MKKSSYQKIKEENLRLKNDIKELILDPDSIESISIKIIFKMNNTPFLNAYKSGTLGNGIAEQIEQLIENAIEANDCVKMDRR